MGGTGPGALDQRRDWRRSAIVITPWIVAAVLAVLGVAGARGTGVAQPSPTPADPEATAAPSTPAGRAAVTTPVVTSPPDVTPETDGPDLLPDVELAVLAAARVAMGTAGVAATGGTQDRWTLAAVLSSVEAVTPEYAVATVHGLVIEHREGGWHGPVPQAAAVLLRLVPSPAVVGRAWPLAPPASPTATPRLRPVEDPDASVVAPLTEAGWWVDEVTAVETTDDSLLQVALRGTSPGDDRSNDHVVWLLDAPGGPRLLPLDGPTETEELP